MILQPVNIVDTPEYFRKFHNEIKQAFTPMGQENKLAATMSHYLRLAWTEALISEKNFMFIAKDGGQTFIVIVNIKEEEIQAIELPPIPENLHLLLALASSMAEENELDFTDTCVRISNIFIRIGQ